MSTQTSLQEILGEIEQDAQSELQLFPAGRTCCCKACRCNREKLLLVKALRQAVLGFETIREMAEHTESRSSRYAHGKLKDISALLIEPVEPEEVENRNLGEPGGTNAR